MVESMRRTERTCLPACVSFRSTMMLGKQENGRALYDELMRRDGDGWGMSVVVGVSRGELVNGNDERLTGLTHLIESRVPVNILLPSPSSFRMSASRPKLGKIKPRPRQQTPPVAPTPTSARPSVATKPVARNVGPTGAPRPSASAVAARAIQEHKVKGKARAPPSRPPPPPKPISVHGTSSDDEEDFEEVPIPSAGPSSPFRTPVGTDRTAEGTPGTLTSAPSVDDDYAGYGESSEGEEEEVIRLEIGGETEEEKAKRIALAMRK